MDDLISNVFKHSPDCFAVLSFPELILERCNKQFEREICGGSIQDAQGKNIFTILSWENEVARTKQAVENIEREGFFTDLVTDENALSYLYRIESDDSRKVLCRISRRVENSSQRQYRQLFEKNVAGVYSIDLKGSIINCNSAFAHLLGYHDASELRGRNAEIFYTNKDHRRRYLEAIRINPQLVNYEIQLQRKDGSVITCLENAFLEVNDKAEEVVHGTLIDISKQKDREHELKDRELRFKTFSEITLESTVFIHGTHIIDCNDQFAQLFGYHDRSDIIGRSIVEFISIEDFKRISEAIRVPGLNKTEVRSTSRDGRGLHLDVTGSQLRYQSVDAIALLIYDITARKRAEFAREQSMVRFRNLLENSPSGVCLVTEGKIRYLNQAAVLLFGGEDEDGLYDYDFFNFIREEYKDEILEDFKNIRDGEEVEYKEIGIKDLNGKDVEVGIKSALTVFENKPSIQVMLNNITAKTQLVQEQMRVRLIEEINSVLKKEIEEHHKTQKKLIAAQNYAQNLIDSSIDMIIASNSSDKITEFNNAAAVQFGYTQQEIIGKTVKMLYSDHGEYERINEHLTKSGIFTGEIHNRKKDGTIFTALLSASRIRNQDGEVLGSMGVSRDITEYRANEKRALEQKAKLEAIYNSTGNMMLWTLDREHRITSMNTNFTKGMLEDFGIRIKPEKDFLKILEKHLDPDLHQGQIEGFYNAFKGRPQQFELPMRDKLKKTIWMQVFLNPVHLGEKQEEVSCLVYDITERKAIDRRVRDSLKEKEVLLQEVHHRVKNNLQVISSILNLQSSFVSDPKILELLQESQNRIKSMSFIHETLYRTTDFSSVSFSEYIRTLVNNLVQSYRTEAAKVELEMTMDEIQLSLDQAIPCGLIINELVSNSLKYAFKGKKKGRLSIRVADKGDQVELKVSDNGVGLPEDFRYEESESLGIQLVYTLVEQLEGRVQVLSTRGAEFLITFEKH